MKKLLVVAFLLLPVLASAAEIKVGEKVPAFKLTNAVDGKTVSFQPGDGKLSVVVFTCNQCPYAKAFQPRLNEIATKYAAKGVKFYAVNPNENGFFNAESAENMKERALEQKFPFPYLKDADSAVARSYGARVTPHVFVVDGKGTLRYRGYIDDSAKPEQRSKTGLTNALDALLASGQVAETVTREFGCTIKWNS